MNIGVNIGVNKMFGLLCVCGLGGCRALFHSVVHICVRCEFMCE